MKRGRSAIDTHVRGRQCAGRSSQSDGDTEHVRLGELAHTAKPADEVDVEPPHKRLFPEFIDQ